MAEKKIYYHFASDPSREYTLNLPCEGRVSCKFARQHIIIQHTVRPDSKCFFELYRNVSTDAGNPEYKLVDTSEDILTETRLLVKRRPITRGDLEQDAYLSFDSLAPTLHNIIHSDTVADKLTTRHGDSLIDSNRQGIRELSKEMLNALLDKIDNNVTMTIGKSTRSDIIDQFNIDSCPTVTREGQQFLIGQANRIHQSVSKNAANEEELDEDEDDKEKTTSNIAELWEKAMGYPKSFLSTSLLRESAQTPVATSSASTTNAYGSSFANNYSHVNPLPAYGSSNAPSTAHTSNYGHKPDFRQQENKSSGSHFHHNRRSRDYGKEPIKVVLPGDRGSK